jgi:hypothetical protein
MLQSTQTTRVLSSSLIEAALALVRALAAHYGELVAQVRVRPKLYRIAAEL